MCHPCHQARVKVGRLRGMMEDMVLWDNRAPEISLIEVDNLAHPGQDPRGGIMVSALAQPTIGYKTEALPSTNPVQQQVNLLKVGEVLDPIRHKPS
jgi:hypothetical protein